MLKIYNTIEKSLSEVRPIEEGVVKMYTCGPTVYRDAHIGNLRSYLMADWIRRALTAQGVEVVHIKNITDVGHMRQEMLERGEDKIIAAALEEGKTPAEIADFYTQRFRADELKLRIQPAHEFPKATDHIQEMIEITERLVDEGYAYEVDGNVYFEVTKFPDYGKLSGNIHEAELLEAVRTEADPLKRDPRDFTLWKAAEPGRMVKWDSPWGEGFPGWHIECSAMSIKYLGETFDIHTGGVDNIFPHHEGEIAQSEGFTGKPVVNSWVHGQHLLADGVKMAKSAGNSFIMSDIEAQGLDPMAFRYLCMTARYNTRLNFTFTSLRAAQRGLQRLKNRVWQWMMEEDEASMSGNAEPDAAQLESWTRAFFNAVNDNLDMPAALALTWELARSDASASTKLAAIRRFDDTLGLNLLSVGDEYAAPQEALQQLLRRAQLRDMKEYAAADAIRDGPRRGGLRGRRPRARQPHPSQSRVGEADRAARRRIGSRRSAVAAGRRRRARLHRRRRRLQLRGRREARSRQRPEVGGRPRRRVRHTGQRLHGRRRRLPRRLGGVGRPRPRHPRRPRAGRGRRQEYSAEAELGARSNPAGYERRGQRRHIRTNPQDA